MKKIDNYIWKIPRTGDMKVPGIVFASQELIKDIQKDDTLKQVENVAKLPGIINKSVAMPDAHTGYGFSIGGVAAFDLEKGIVSPGGVGFDINCGVRLLKTNLTKSDIDKKGRKELIHSLFRAVPSGVGREGKINLTKKDLDDVLEKGVKWCLEKGYANKKDLENCEDNGCLPGNSKDVSERAKKRGIGQLGTLGAGNHFLEMQVVDKIFDEKIAEKLGLQKNQILIMIHCGSRGLGHQVASDYIKKMEENGWPEFDRQLVNAPIKSDLGKKYLSAMNCSANFAFANRQIIMNFVIENLKHYFPNLKTELVYDVCHNIAKFENHKVNGKEKKVLVMRKGATRAFPRQPVIIPGSMGTFSYLLLGNEKSLELSWGSTAHGAGRVKSRTESRKTINSNEVKKQLNEKDILIEAGSFKGIAEESPNSYKDIDEVVRVSNELGIAKLVVRLKPLGVIKG